MVLDPRNDSFLRSLQEIRDKAANLRKLTEQALALRGVSTSHSDSPPPIPIPSLNLPLPADMTSFLNDLDISDFAIAQLTSKIQDWVGKIQQLYRQKFESTCQQLLAVPQSSNSRLLIDKIESIRQTFQQTYLNHDLPRINRRILLLHSQLPRSCTMDKKFKNEYRPLLDKYFQLNAYPSAQERLNLARKTRMTPRQIEVWFQNHRNRSKKDGKSLSRYSGPPLNFESWDIEKFAFDGESDDELSETSISDNSPSDTNSGPYPFSSTSPPHAFPNKYPPDCSTDPFSTNNGIFTFPSITWLRKPVESVVVPQPLRTSAIDELTQMFACKLNLRENVSKTRRQTKNGHDRPRLHSATTVVPYPAPLPSLVRKACNTPFRTRVPLGHSDPLFGAPSVLSSAERYPTRLRNVDSIHRRPTFTMSQPSFFPSTSSSYRSRVSSTSSLSSIEPLTPVSSRPSSPVIQVVDNMPECQDQIYPFDDFPFDVALLPVELHCHKTLPQCDFSNFANFIPEMADL